jgi:hypothetical protein
MPKPKWRPESGINVASSDPRYDITWNPDDDKFYVHPVGEAVALEIRRNKGSIRQAIYNTAWGAQLCVRNLTFGHYQPVTPTP